MSRSGPQGPESRLKVLQVLPSVDIGGAERMLLTLLDELDPNIFDR
jgi:hypothetical protein